MGVRQQMEISKPLFFCDSATEAALRCCLTRKAVPLLTLIHGNGRYMPTVPETAEASPFDYMVAYPRATSPHHHNQPAIKP